MQKPFGAALREESGATAIEYGIIAGMIALVIIGAVSLVGSDLGSIFQGLANSL